MNRHEEAIRIVNQMVSEGFKLVGETAEQFAARYEGIPGVDTLAFLNEMLENVKKWRA